MKNRSRLITLILALFLTIGAAFGQGAQAKYVFLFIGDGMALAQVSAAEIYTRALVGREPGFNRLGFTQFPAQGIATTYDSSSIITDSASAITAIATGNKTLSGVINMDVGKTKKFKTIAEYAKDNGMKVGVVTTVSLDHATPAGYYAKVPSRSDYYDISLQLVASGFDYFGGGGFLQPKGKNGDKPDIIDLAKKNGYTFVNSVAAFRALTPSAGKVLAVNPTLQDSMAMPYEIDRDSRDLSLADYVSKGIELLDNPKGFFFAVEGGKIDWACHANDAAASINDTLALDRAITRAVEFQKKHPEDTLIIVTGDHETGGMSIGFAGTQYSTFFEKVFLQQGSYVAFNDNVLTPYKKRNTLATAKLNDLLPTIKDFFGIDYEKLDDASKEMLQRSFVRSMKGEVERAPQESVYQLYGGYEPLTVTLTHLANQAAGIGWTTYSHTGVPVPVYALGFDQQLFDGYYDNTDLFYKMATAMGIKVPAAAVALK
jgi:alkaline phosphatase